jgi:hypothetical protein
LRETHAIWVFMMPEYSRDQATRRLGSLFSLIRKMYLVQL